MPRQHKTFYWIVFFDWTFIVTGKAYHHAPFNVFFYQHYAFAIPSSLPVYNYLLIMRRGISMKRSCLYFSLRRCGKPGCFATLDLLSRRYYILGAQQLLLKPGNHELRFCTWYPLLPYFISEIMLYSERFSEMCELCNIFYALYNRQKKQVYIFVLVFHRILDKSALDFYPGPFSFGNIAG